MRFVQLTFILALLAGGTSGCVSIARTFGLIPTEPKVELQSVAVRTISLSGIELMVTLQLTNRDERALQMQGLKFDLFLDELKFATGDRPEPLTIAGQQQAELQIPLSVRYAESSKIIESLVRGKFPSQARVAGSVVIDTAFGGVAVPFSKTTKLER
jgi:LEA14-like dessication related protein